jgi:Protein phosphatase 2C
VTGVTAQTSLAVQVSHATQAACPGRVNEDWGGGGPGWALVLDGATPAPGVATGCRHDVPWLVRHLAAALAGRLTRSGAGPEPDPLAGPLPLAGAGPGPGSLADLLADAIGELRDAHGGRCDLGNPDSPSATVAMARIRGRGLEYLVLCDSPVLLGHPGGGCTLVADDRLTRLPGGPPYRVDLVRACRNQPGGFWVASTAPAAAYQAVTGSAELAELTDVALCTDGVSRLAEWYGYSWPRVMARLRELGPAGLLGLLRAAERGYPHPRDKRHDDATVARLSW